MARGAVTGVLVTGAGGFVGGALCRHLADRGLAVRGAVRRAPENPEAGVEYVHVGDIHQGTDWRGALSGVDAVVHAAARVHVMAEEAKDPLAEFRRVNVAGSETLARQAAAAHVGRLLFLSSVKVLGEATGSQPFTDLTPPAPRDPYGASKWEAEQTISRVASATGMEVVVLRLPLVYGPRVKGNFLTLLRACRAGWPLPLAGIGNRRSMIFLGNLVDAVYHGLTRPEAAGGTFLVGDGDGLSTPDLIRRLAQGLDRPARLFPFPAGLLRLAAAGLGQGAAAERLMGSLVIDDRGFRGRLAWHPPVTAAQGLAATAAWFQQLGAKGLGEK